MNVARQASKRPVAVFMLLLAIAALGVIALRRLHLELIPNLEYPYAAVFATYMGAGTEEVEQLVTEPLERIIATVPGVKRFTSVSQPGFSFILIEYAWGVDVLSASSRLERYLSLAQANLPEQVKPSVVEFDPSLLPVFVFSTEQDVESFVDQIKRLPDVAGVEVLGKASKRVVVRLDPEKVEQLGLDLSLMEMFLSGNAIYPMGQVKDENGNVYPITVDARFRNLEELRNAIVGFRGLTYQTAMSGQLPKLLVPIRLGQVASIEVVEEEVRGVVRVNGHSTNVVAVRKRSGANTVESVRQIKNLLKQLKVSYTPLIDQSLYTQRAVNNLLKNLLLGLLCASIVVAIFVPNIFNTLIVSLSIPVSLIIAIVLMYFFKLNFDLLTLGGLTMAVGMLVDNAIVVFENIFRHKSEGQDYLEAASRGTKEVFGAIFASTATTVIVFVPLLFTESFAATMFKYFAATLSLALGASLAVAGVLVPAGSKWIMSRKIEAYEKFRITYKNSLERLLDRKVVVLPLVLVILLFSVFVLMNRPRSFTPKFESNTLSIVVKMNEQAGYEKTSQVVSELEKFILERKEKFNVQHVYCEVGITSELSQIVGGASEDKGTIYVWFGGKRTEYVENKKALLSELQKFQIQGATLSVGESDFMSELFGYPLTIVLRGKDIDLLLKEAERLSDALKQKGIGQVAVRGKATLQTMMVDIDRTKAIFSGLLPGQLLMEFQRRTVGQAIGIVSTEEGSLPVFLKVSSLGTVEDVGGVVFKNMRNQQIPLDVIANVEKRQTLTSISHMNGERVVYVDVTESQFSVSKLTRIAEETINDLKLKVDHEFSGQKNSMDTLFSEFRTIIIIAAILVYMFLAAQFESLVVPFIIFMSVPIALVALTLTMLIFNYELNLPVLVGSLTLVGTVVNNAIVMVSFVLQRRREAKEVSFRTIITESASLRLRPILMTSLTTILALLPVALSRAEGSELESPIAWTIILGLSITTLFTLYVVPMLLELLLKRSTRA
ncbi:cation transporter [Pseudothermotoga hypogea DSM 11164 = NBRC 106472]|uniref:Cation transporter n=2 Tax=Pseudothermotoga TaxID=1643951 RepID=A0A0X1KRW1_9THEM|nr:efflux RND transporter permease subunit [Pseudothermotoga hypogea]AJC74058.1 cation transporter [Pseudothermotoga hypogea DSM 11164 = NBRC 106472]